MIVYHGTGLYNLPKLLASAPQKSSRPYLKWKRAFSTTTDFKIAALFAMRRSPPAALRDEKEVGIVLEYELAWASQEGKDWVHAKEPGVLQDEKEVAVFKISALELQAVYRLENSIWVRRSMDQVAGIAR